MGQRWLFRVDVAGERETGETEKARGLGHAIKCLSVAQAVHEAGGTVHFSVEGAEDVGPLFDEAGVDYDLTSDHGAVIEAFDPHVIVTDVNYLDVDLMNAYREAATVVNLAPRGACKYYADLSFTSFRIEDVPRPRDAPLVRWYAGPEYAILNRAFVDLRNEMDSWGAAEEHHGIVLQMGGVDQANMTGAVLDALDEERLQGRTLTVIAGPLNPHIDDLRRQCSRIDGAEFLVDPDDFAEIVASHEIGIFGTGISTFEALSVGVPSINFGLSTFHDMRGELLNSTGLSLYLGRFDEIDRPRFNSTLFSLLDGGGSLAEMRDEGISRIDGRAPERIVDTVRRHRR